MKMPDGFQLDSGSRTVLTKELCDKMGWKLNTHTQYKSMEWLASSIADFVAKSPLYRNISEFHRDADYQHYHWCMTEQSDGYSGTLRTQHFLDEEKARWTRLEMILENANNQLAFYRRWNDVDGIKTFCVEMEMHISDVENEASSKYMEELQRLLDKARDLLSYL